MKKVIAALLVSALVLSLAGCAQKKSDGLVNGKIVDGFLGMNEAEIAFASQWQDTADNGFANDSRPDNYELKTFSSVSQMLMELDAGKLSFFGAVPLSTAKYICAANPDYSYIECDANQYFKMAVTEDKKDIQESLNSSIAALKSDGTLDNLKKTYIDNVTSAPEKNTLAHIDGAETIKVGVTGDYPPFDYIAADGTPAGFNVALLNALAEKMNVNFELVSIEANARTTALSTGVIDMVFWILVYENQTDATYPEGKLLFTDSYFDSHDAMVTKDYPVESIKKIYGLK